MLVFLHSGGREGVRKEGYCFFRDLAQPSIVLFILSILHTYNFISWNSSAKPLKMKIPVYFFFVERRG